MDLSRVGVIATVIIAGGIIFLGIANTIACGGVFVLP